MHEILPTNQNLTLRPEAFFDLSRPDVSKLFENVDLVWEILPKLRDLVAEMTGSRESVEGVVMPGAILGEQPIYIGPGAIVEPGAYIQGPAYIGPNVVIRHGAYVRSGCIFLESSVLGHASEAKNSLFLPFAKAPHFAYVGDSILGQGVNLGAGTKLSNLPIQLGPERRTLKISHGGEEIDTRLTKLGAILGDDVETGCNVVTNPASLVLPRTVVYPATVVQRGVYPGDSILKLRQEIEYGKMLR